MLDLPGPGLEPVSPALAGGFLTTASPGKPCSALLLTFLGLLGWPKAHPIIKSDESDLWWVIRELLYLPLVSVFPKRNGKRDQTSAQRKNSEMVDFHEPFRLGEDKAVGVSGSPKFFKSHQKDSELLCLTTRKGLQGNTLSLDMKSIPSWSMLTTGHYNRHSLPLGNQHNDM